VYAPLAHRMGLYKSWLMLYKVILLIWLGIVLLSYKIIVT
jgi:hypothetical protein